MIPIHDGLAPLAERYDGYIVDLWGVMHDGLRAYPEAVACLGRLRALGKRVLLLSNAPRRVAQIMARNEEIGIPKTLATAVMSSGEDTWRHLSTRPDAWYRALGKRCYHLGPERDYNMREGLNLTFVEDLGEADFVLNTGALGEDDTVADYEDFLQDALRHGLRMICANPDLEVMRGEHREICAGIVAARYAEIGGEVRYHGKPHAGIYDACFPLLKDIPRARIAAIGDTLRTDIAGANTVGIAGIFVMNGLQAGQLGVDARGYAKPERLAAQCLAEGHRPDAALPVLRWDTHGMDKTREPDGTR